MNDAAPNTCSIGVADMSTLPSWSLESQTSNNNEIKYYTTNYIDIVIFLILPVLEAEVEKDAIHSRFPIKI